MIQKPTFSAGETKEFNEAGDYFRLLNSTAEITVTFYFQGREVAKAEGISGGYAERFRAGQFDRIQVYSAAAQTLQFVSRLGNDVQYDAPPMGLVTLANMQGAFTQAQANVTNVTGQLLAAKVARRYLLIQNNDTSGDVFVTLDGTAATTLKGIKIKAGGSLELANYCPTGAINAIGSVANNTAVVVVEG